MSAAMAVSPANTAQCTSPAGRVRPTAIPSPWAQTFDDDSGATPWDPALSCLLRQHRCRVRGASARPVLATLLVAARSCRSSAEVWSDPHGTGLT